MSKYDFPLDLSEKTSGGQIMRRVPEGSKVLEFGCAAGRMTRYLKERLHCEVFIVEIDKDAYVCAEKYADRGICCDANTLEWQTLFAGQTFDRIIFI